MTRCIRRNRSKARLRAVVVAVGIALAALLVPAAAGAAGPWVDGKADQDTIENCLTGKPAVGVMGGIAWRSQADHVPYVGETFTLRATASLVGMPCSGQVAMLAEFLAPLDVVYGDENKHPVRWGIRQLGEPENLRTGGLAYHPGSNGGVLLLREGDQPFILKRGDVLEIEVPVVAQRVLKGKATREPECLDRRNGVAPCPVGESGDHFQVAFRVGGHGGDKTYVTPYVGLFAQAKKTAARTKVNLGTTFKAFAKKKGTAKIVIKPARLGAGPATGKVVIGKGGKVLATAMLKKSHHGVITLRLPKLKKGKHTLTVTYQGSATHTKASLKRTIRVG